MNSIRADAKVLFGMTLHEWVNMVQASINRRCGMPDFTLVRGDYGYRSYLCILDNMLTIIESQDIMQFIQRKLDNRRFVVAAHMGWCYNYSEWKTENHEAGTDECNARAMTLAQDLSEEDADMYRQIVEEVFGQLAARLVECGMNTMSIL